MCFKSNKVAAPAIDLHLTNIVNLPINTTTFTLTFKIVNLKRLFKKRNKNKAVNYRLTCLLALIRKVIEYSTHDKIQDPRNSFISINQYSEKNILMDTISLDEIKCRKFFDAAVEVEIIPFKHTSFFVITGIYIRCFIIFV